MTHFGFVAGKVIPRLYSSAKEGQLLPSAREVSTRCFSSVLEDKGLDLDTKVNQNHMQFGQFFAHDLGLTPVMTGQSDCFDLNQGGECLGGGGGGRV